MPPRPPLIVQVPTALSMVIAQVRREESARKMTPANIKALKDRIAALTKSLVPDVRLRNLSTKHKLHLRADIGGECLYLAQTIGNRFEIAAWKTIDSPFGKGVLAQIEEEIRAVIRDREPRIRDHLRLNEGLPENTRAQRDGDEVTFTIEGLSDKGFKRVVEALHPLINLDRFNREDPI